MNVVFELLSPLKDESRLRLVIYIGEYRIVDGKKKYERFRSTLPFVIPTALWNKETQEVNKHKNFKESIVINRTLAKIKADMKDYELQKHLAVEPITTEGVKEVLDAVIAPKVKAYKPTYFTEVFAQYIKDSEDGIRLKDNGQRISDGTIRRYKLSLWHWENFEEKYGDVTLRDLTKDLGNSLNQHFNNINKAHNTKVNHIRTYISVYNYAVEKGLMEPTDFYKIRIDEIESDTIALTQDEVNTLFDLKLAGERELELIRDTFIIGIWTLMRYGDYSDIEGFNIREKYIKYNTTKTDTPVVIPIHWQLGKILEKYNGKLPDAPSEPVFNRHIKKIAKRAGITQLEEIREHKGGKVIKKLVPRNDLITTHTARRTGATLLYLDGIPKKQIMLLTGHKQEKNFDRYIRIGAFANAQLLSDRDIFKEPGQAVWSSDRFEDGFYWVRKKGDPTVVQIKNGIMKFIGNNVIAVETWMDQGGSVLQYIKAPQ